MRFAKTVAAVAATATIGSGLIAGAVMPASAAATNPTVAKIAAGPVVGVGFGRRNATVQRLQKALSEAGYPVPATAYFGPMTRDAVKAYQKDNGIPETGYAGKLTWAALQAGKAKSAGSGTAAPAAKPAAAAAPAAKAANLTPASGNSCGASYYDEPQMTASGERFNPNDMTAAHKTLPLGSRVKVTNPSTGATVVVRINDRGPYVGGRCLDLSRAAFSAIGNTGAGVMNVTYQVL